jgi:hypothetical protein
VAATRCERCREQQRSARVYEGRCTRCCVSCAEVHDPEWHAAYVAATRCERCREQRRATNVYEGRSTRCCISCAEVQDPEWHAAYVAATRCERCREQQRVTPVYEGRSTRCCVSCAKVHDPEWHAAYVAATCCERCREQKRAANVYEGRSTRCCVSCAKVQDPEWHAAWVRSLLCRDHSVNGCGTFGGKGTRGYCARCFAHRFPEDRRARFVRSKELAVARFLRESFPEVTWSFDRRIEGGCSRRRPDAFVHLGSHALSIETDEGEHAGEAYSCLCEHRKMMEHFQDAGGVPHVFVRFNPDAYVDHAGVKRPGCWDRTPKTQEPRVAPRRREAWEARLETLRATVARHLARARRRASWSWSCCTTRAIRESAPTFEARAQKGARELVGTCARLWKRKRKALRTLLGRRARQPSRSLEDVERQGIPSWRRRPLGAD